MSLRLAGLAALAVVALAAAQQAPAPPSITGAVSGRVVEQGTGKPVEEALVELRLAPSLTSSVFRPRSAYYLTAGDGRFEFREVVPATYQLLASRTGVPGVSAGASGSTSLTVLAGQSVKGIDVTVSPLPRRSSIQGRVTDERDQPLMGVTVRAIRASALSGTIARTFEPNARTNDRGEYRITVDRGAYAVFVEVDHGTSDPSAFNSMIFFGEGSERVPQGPRDSSGVYVERGHEGLISPAPDATGRTMTYVTTFAPGVRSRVAARIITVAPGEDTPGIDVRITLARSFRVSGRIEGVGHDPQVVVSVKLRSRDLPEGMFAATMAATSETLAMMDVPEGDYVLEASRTFGRGDAFSHDQESLWARMPVAVHAGVTDNWTITLTPGVRVSGIVEFDDPPPPSLQVDVMLEPATADSWSRSLGTGSAAAVQGRFAIAAVAPGRYVVRARVSNGPGWALASANVGGADVADHPLEVGTSGLDGVVVRLTHRPSSISGTVRNSNGATREGIVIAFPIDRAEWIDLGDRNRRLLKASATSDGRFRLPLVPAGDYYVAILDAARAGEWPSPDLFDSLIPFATRVSLSAGEDRVTDLRVAGR